MLPRNAKHDLRMNRNERWLHELGNAPQSCTNFLFVWPAFGAPCARAANYDTSPRKLRVIILEAKHCCVLCAQNKVCPLDGSLWSASGRPTEIVIIPPSQPAGSSAGELVKPETRGSARDLFMP